MLVLLIIGIFFNQNIRIKSNTEEYENNSENSAYAFYVCDECNYRWEDIDIEKKGNTTV